MKTTRLQDIYLDGLARHGSQTGNAYDRRVYAALARKGLVEGVSGTGRAAGFTFYRLTAEGRAWHDGRWARAVAEAQKNREKKEK